MKIEDVMNDKVIVVGENEHVEHARKLMLKNGFSRIIVVDREEKPVGMVTEKDLTRKMRGKGPKWKMRPIDKISIRRVMTPNPVTVAPQDDVKTAVEIMIKQGISSIPVADEDGLAGLITKTDIMNFYSEKFTGRWKVSKLMTPEVITVNENHSIAHVIGVMEENNIGKVVVIRDNEPVGMITPENISFAYVEDPETGVNVEKIYFLRNSEEGKSKKNVRMVSMLTAGDIMQNDMIRISGDEDAAKAADIMIREDIGGLPVVEGDDLTGIITKTDIIKGIQ